MIRKASLLAGEPWALILAAGEGSRLRAWTRDSQGNPVPKQFCRFGGRLCLLQETWRRAAGIASRRKILAVVAAQHRRFWQSLESGGEKAPWVVQPRNVGTAAGILLPLLKIYRQDIKATVVVLPSDHFIGQEPRFSQALHQALISTRQHPDRLALIGIRPEGPEADYGWILPGNFLRKAPRPVAAFREKPGRDQAQRLLAQGALISSFAFAATAETLLALYDRHLPMLAELFRHALLGAPDFEAAVTSLYQQELPGYDFSRHLLEPAADKLLVIEARDCQWTDLGTPERLLAHLQRMERSQENGKGERKGSKRRQERPAPAKNGDFRAPAGMENTFLWQPHPPSALLVGPAEISPCASFAAPCAPPV